MAVVITYLPLRFFPPTPKSPWMRKQIAARACAQVQRAVEAWQGFCLIVIEPAPQEQVQVQRA
jgi:hypothetical protein